MGVYHKIPRRVAKLSDKKMIQTRWIDVNKGDKANPDYRSRLVAKEFKEKGMGGADTFAATPPAEMLKVLISRCTTARDGGSHKMRERCIMTNGVKRAYFYAQVRSEIFIEIPPEDRTAEDDEQDNVAQLQLSMYGTREAAVAWQSKVKEVVHRLGFETCIANPCIFKHHAMNIEPMVHGDDLISIGDRNALNWFRRQLEQEFEIKTTIIGWKDSLEK